MSQRHDKVRNLNEGLITALAFGGFFIVLGLIIVSTPNITDQTNNFFQDFTGVTYPLGDGTLVLPAPAHPAAHTGFFTAVINFILGIGILQIVILALRLAWKSRLSRIAETVGNLVFWLGAAGVANVFLLAGTQTGWFQFWAFLLILIGAGLIVRFVVYFAAKGLVHGKE